MMQVNVQTRELAERVGGKRGKRHEQGKAKKGLRVTKDEKQ
jgi:hypothetical protein